MRKIETATESKTQLVERINAYLRSGDYSRALDLLRGAAAKFPNDAEFPALEKRAQEGASRKAEADRLITESQEMFAQQKSVEAIQWLRKAYELDRTNSLARSILANALVEHAHSVVETDWLEAEKLSNQALALNPAHPTAKTILNQIVHKKETSSVDDWVWQARKLHDSGDLFAALAWVAEGLAVHPHDPKLLQVQDAVQRDQEARRRQVRRGDLDELRRLQQEIAKAADAAAKQALVECIQAIAAKHWTDGEILSIANALLLRLGLVPQESSTASQRRKGATVIFHVPRPNASEAPPPETSPIASSQSTPSLIGASKVRPRPAPTSVVPSTAVSPEKISPGTASPSTVAPSVGGPKKAPRGKVLPRTAVPAKVVTAPPEPPRPTPQAATPFAAMPSAPEAKPAPRSKRQKEPLKSNSTTLILASAVAIILVVGLFCLARRHPVSDVAKAPEPAPTVSAPAVSTPTISAPPNSTPEQTQPEPAPASSTPSDTSAAKVILPEPPPAESAGSVPATLVVVAGQDGARVALNGIFQRQRTQAGQLRLPNLAPKDYVVQVSKPGFQDPPQQKIHLRKGEQASLIFNLQPPLVHLASLTIAGAAPGTAVFLDQVPIGTVQPDGTLSISSVNPGDHTVELRKDRYKPRQFKKHFVAGAVISLAAADATLEAAPGELKITFAPADANVAIVKGDLLKMVSSGVPFNLPAGTYTLTAHTADRFTRTATLEVGAGQSRALDLSLAPNGMSKWGNPGAWKQEKDSFLRKGGDFVLYGAVPTSGTFIFSAMPTKGHLLQWVLNYTDSQNYLLCQMDDNYFYRTVIRHGQKTDEIRVTDKGDKKSFRTLHIRVSPTEVVHQIKHGDSWTVVDRWAPSGADLSRGKFGFYIPGNDEVAVTRFAHYPDLNIR